MPGYLLPDPAPRLACCRPLRLAFPSGRRFAHSRFCPDKPGQKLDAVERGILGLPAITRPRALTPAEADRIHPKGELALRSWLAHPAGCRCAACGYVDDHLDDEMEDASP